MNDQELRQLLADIQAEIDKTEPGDEKERELLFQLRADVRRYLNMPEGERPDADEPFVERLNDAVDRFQLTYPELTMMLSRMSSILSNAGI